MKEDLADMRQTLRRIDQRLESGVPVNLTDVDIPFWSLVGLLFKMMPAYLIALGMLVLIVFLAAFVLALLFGSFWQIL